MIVDASAIVAIARGEPEAPTFAQMMAAADARRLSAVGYVEAAIAVDRERDVAASRRFDTMLRDARMVVEAVTHEQARIAREAFREYGRGSGHPARLNLGDCFAYALARVYNEPMLYKGDDFGHTDVRSATG